MTIELTRLQHRLYKALKEHPKGLTTAQAREAVENGKVDSHIRGLIRHGITVVFEPTTKRYVMEDVKDEVTVGESYASLVEKAKKVAESHIVTEHKKAAIKVQALTDLIIEQMKPLIVPLDPETIDAVKVREFKGKAVHDAEEMAGVLTDVHVGKVTKTFNVEIAQDRLNNYRDGLLSVLHIQRAWNPVKRLHLFMLGDIIDGETLYPGQAFENEGMTVMEEIFTYAVPMFSRFLVEMSKNFELVTVDCVPGNHGRVSKHSAKATNWDTVFYKCLECVLANVENIKFVFPQKTDFYIVANVLGHKFLLTHGAEIRAYYNTPVYAWVRHSERWRSSIDRDIRYFIFGHFHTISKGNEFNGIEILSGGTFVSDDTFSIQGMALQPSTKQLLFGINAKHGITWEYAMDLGYKHSKK